MAEEQSQPSALTRPQRPRRAAFVYMAVLVVASVGVLLWGMMSDPELGLALDDRHLSSLLIWILPIALVARFLSFSLGNVTFSLDTPVFLAAMFHLGPLPSAFAVLVVMSVYAGYRVARRLGPYAQPEPWLARGLRVMFAPLATAALAMLFSSLAGTLWTDPAHPQGGFAILALRVVAVAMAFLIMQFAVILGRYALEGQAIGKLLRGTAAPALVAEMAMLPLTALFIWTLDRSDPVPFFVLGGSSLVLADIFRRLARSRASTLKTVAELERLVTIGERIFATMGFRQVLGALVEAIATEVPHHQRALAGIWDDDREPPGCQIAAMGRAGQLDPAVDELALQEALSQRLLHGRPATFYVEGPGGPWTALIVPFSMAGKPEGFIGVDLGPAAGDHAGAEPGSPIASARESLRRMASIAGVAIHNARLYREATIDGLTGLYVRRFFDRRFTEEVARCRRVGGALSVLLIDLDDFKLVNDRHGHQAGDRVLQWLAGLLQSAIRLTDVPCRYGGDEFVVLLPDARIEDARRIAERLIASIETQAFVFDDDETTVTASVGVAGMNSATGAAVPDLVAAADAALFKAKRKLGKGQIAIAVAAAEDDRPDSDGFTMDITG